MMMAAEKRYCLYCEKLLRGRSDKLYCDDACRNSYFNEQKKNDHQAIRAVDLALKKNRRILRDILGDNKTRSVTEKQLLQKGYDFRYHTHFFATKNEDRYCFCYDYGWLAREDNKYMVVKELIK
jgi:hypothetical protein